MAMSSLRLVGPRPWSNNETVRAYQQVPDEKRVSFAIIFHVVNLRCYYAGCLRTYGLCPVLGGDSVIRTNACCVNDQGTLFLALANAPPTSRAAFSASTTVSKVICSTLWEWPVGEEKPRAMADLRPCRQITQLASTSTPIRVVALSDEGDVFCTHDLHEQMPVFPSDERAIIVPTILPIHEPVRAVACGKTHVLLLTLVGRVLTFGCGKYVCARTCTHFVLFVRLVSRTFAPVIKFSLSFVQLTATGSLVTAAS